MKEFKEISIERILDKYGNEKKVIINNPKNYRYIGRGLQGMVFQLDHERCVKIYFKEKNVDLEMKAYHLVKRYSFIPKIFESGSNYIVMEFIEGPSLFEYLKKKKYLRKSISRQILRIQRKVKKAGFTRIESKLDHFIVPEGDVIKFVDHSNAFAYVQPYPNELFTDLRKLGLLHVFLEHAKELDPIQYHEWEKTVDFNKL